MSAGHRDESHVLRALATLGRLIDLAMRVAVGLLVVALVAVVGAEFVDRRVFDLGIAAPDQYARIGLVWLTFIGFALAIRNGVNVRVDLVDARLPAPVRRALSIVFDVAIGVLCGLTIAQAWRLIEIGSDQLLLGTPVSAAVPAWGLFVACVLLLPLLVLRVWRVLRGERPDAEESPH